MARRKLSREEQRERGRALIVEALRPASAFLAMAHEAAMVQRVVQWLRGWPIASKLRVLLAVSSFYHLDEILREELEQRRDEYDEQEK